MSRKWISVINAMCFRGVYTGETPLARNLISNDEWPSDHRQHCDPRPSSFCGRIRGTVDQRLSAVRERQVRKRSADLFLDHFQHRDPSAFGDGAGFEVPVRTGILRHRIAAISAMILWQPKSSRRSPFWPPSEAVAPVTPGIQPDEIHEDIESRNAPPMIPMRRKRELSICSSTPCSTWSRVASTS